MLVHVGFADRCRRSSGTHNDCCGNVRLNDRAARQNDVGAETALTIRAQ
ncbi:MAG TPA: hypothetical protein VJ032_01470 [Thermoanaerobaculia bacterium]|nr:hypothetical protein [Thermoanaerobaculia bacterium]